MQKKPQVKRIDPRAGSNYTPPSPRMVPVLGRTHSGKFNGYHLEDLDADDPESYSYNANYWRMDVNYSARVIINVLGEEVRASIHAAIWPRRSYTRFTWRTISEMLEPVKNLIRKGERNQDVLVAAALDQLQKIQMENEMTEHTNQPVSSSNAMIAR